jgi:hypothetical protein
MIAIVFFAAPDTGQLEIDALEWTTGFAMPKIWVDPPFMDGDGSDFAICSLLVICSWGLGRSNLQTFVNISANVARQRRSRRFFIE